MKLNPTNTRKLMSISALGAGALVASMGEAEATIVFTDLTSNPAANVGFSSGFASAFSTRKTTFGSVGFKLSKASFNTSGFNRTSHALFVNLFGLGGVQFATSSHGFAVAQNLALFTAGAALGPAVVKPGVVAASRKWTHFHSVYRSRNYYYPFGYLTHTIDTTFNGASPGGFPDKFALFKFDFNAQTYYGWLELSLNNIAHFGTGDGFGPDLTVLGWAFDNSGAAITAGEMPTEVPEPGTFEMTGLAALALGAVGVRRWRAARLAKTKS